MAALSVTIRLPSGTGRRSMMAAASALLGDQSWAVPWVASRNANFARVECSKAALAPTGIAIVSRTQSVKLIITISQATRDGF